MWSLHWFAISQLLAKEDQGWQTLASSGAEYREEFKYV